MHIIIYPPDKSAYLKKYFLISQRKHMLLVLNSFKYPQHMLWLRNDKIIFQVWTLKHRFTQMGIWKKLQFYAKMSAYLDVRNY